ncbi:DUF222 domain-containing protein [Rhizohabitans arisaemae]|uniref:DUF222 domain-containing protein n=1 Tax=Rhizohabitans arisaemae TaxID=2720610 RepID=UPI0024B24BA1|nr:DUF222 domain-containing protein [Rhizohabitans arisaemae]
MTQRVPAGLAQMPPGAELGRVLATIDIRRVSDSDAVEVLKAWHRQCAHDDAMFMAAMVEVGLRTPGPDSLVCRTDVPDEFSADELRPALVWSRRRAETRFAEAWDLMSRLPAVHAALGRGRIDKAKAQALATWTRGLTDGQAQVVCDRLLPLAETVTVAALIDAVKRAAVGIDPEWAERHYKAAVRERRVVGSRNPDGTANLSGVDQPVERVTAACARVDALARRAKTAGDRRPTQHIRSELFLGMLDASFQCWTDEQIVAWLVADSRRMDDLVRSGAGEGEDARVAAGSADRSGPAGRPGVVETAGASGRGVDRAGREGVAEATDADGVSPGDGTWAGNRRTHRLTGLGPAGGDGSPHASDGNPILPGSRCFTGRDPRPHVRSTGRDLEPRVEMPPAACSQAPGATKTMRINTETVVVSPRSADREPFAGSMPGEQGGSTFGPKKVGDAVVLPRMYEGLGRVPAVGALEVVVPRVGESEREGPVASPRGWSAGELRVEVATLLGLDERPGELAGWGPVHAGLAREIAARQLRGRWRWVLTDDRGRLAACGVTRCRPDLRGDAGPGLPEATTDPAGTGDPRGIVELRFTRADLLRLNALPRLAEGWRRLLVDLTRQATLTSGFGRTNPDRGRPPRSSPGTGDPESVGRGWTTGETEPHEANPVEEEPLGMDPGRASPRRSSGGKSGPGSVGRDRIPGGTEPHGTDPDSTGRGPRFPGAALRR